MSFLDSAINSIGKNLAQCAEKALSDATGVDIGGTLNYVFGDGQEQGGQNINALITSLPSEFTGTAEQLAALGQGLQQQQQEIVNIGAQLGAISQSINTLAVDVKKVESLLQHVAKLQLYQAWQSVDVVLSGYLTVIDTCYSNYVSYLGDYSNTPTALVGDLVQDILNSDNGPKEALNAISNLVVDGAQQQGALQLWCSMVAPLVGSGVLDYRDAIQQYQNYYKRLTYGQLCATNLLMEAYNFSSAPDMAQKAFIDYQELVVQQEGAFIQWMLPLVLAGVSGSVPTPGTPPNFSGIDASMHLNPQVQYLPGDARPGSSYYVPSSLFMKAEELLATLAVNDSSSRRIVVHVLCDDLNGIGSLVKQAVMTITHAGAGNIIQPASTLDFGPYYFQMDNPPPASTLPDPNMVYGGIYLKRMVFTANNTSSPLADGQYQLTNMNNIDGLIPIETYASNNSPVPFLTDSVLQYVMEVNSSEPYDFMNLLAYNAPILCPWG